ncbi:glycoside hydrolase family 16 protein [Actinomadura madurae]|uniref:Licheninase n=1 Tax=Actinomadura madurae TaxID=1993 RepID=A0A1I5C1Q2_9ACTN|nr:glycoside hydrolase family 16 protein [Actinomadura madurae]SFN80888.1 licheninase [Actinomadura madurae]SPT50850.1 Glycosyl hydrolases family 16 [Actinomadura madurae]
MPFSFRRQVVIVTVTAVTVGVLIFAALHESAADIGRTGAAADSHPLPAGERTSAHAPAGTGKAAKSSGGSTAAQRHGWGRPVAADEFDRLDKKAWEVYNGRGHAGKGRRSPSAVTVRDGVLRITGKPDGTTGGLGWRKGEQKTGRWEARVKLNRSCACYNANMLLWPVNGGGGTAPKGGGGEVDYMETYEDNGLRKGAFFFLHFDQREGSEQKGREGNSGRISDHMKVDLTTWHTFAVEWTEKGISGYVDGRRWFHTSRRDVLPPGPMGQAIQLDWMPHLKKLTAPSIDLKRKNRLAVLEVDWIRMYGV